MERRNFIKISTLLPFFLLLQKNRALSYLENSFDNESFYYQLIKDISDKDRKLPIGELIILLAKKFIGTPYKSNTLDVELKEECRVDFSGLDCVTFFENVLCIARILKKGKNNFDDLINEITFTRYRNGMIEDYASRLHYTSEWITDNIKKGIIEDVTKKLGGEVFPFNLNFMSQNPNYYKPLREDTLLIKKIKENEININKERLYYIKKENIQSIEKKLKNGDIIAFTTNKTGLDYSHTGFAINDKGTVKLLHASSKQKKVVIDKPIHEYIASKKSDTGISVLRPLEI